MSSPLPGIEGLAVSDLVHLANLLRAGRLASPYRQLSLELEGVASAASIAADLTRLQAEGFGTSQLAWLLQLLASAHKRSEDMRGRIEIVVTGPDAAAASRDTAIVVNELFGAASHSILVTGFALHDGRSILRRLAERLDTTPALRATLCLDISRPTGDSSSDDEILARFAAHFRRKDWPGRAVPRIFFDPRALAPWDQARAVLHAKCIVVDDAQALVTSANLTDAAQTRNIEVGLLVKMPSIAGAIGQHFERLIEGGFLKRLAI